MKVLIQLNRFRCAVGALVGTNFFCSQHELPAQPLFISYHWHAGGLFVHLAYKRFSCLRYTRHPAFSSIPILWAL
jgi:hypothetical protein